MIRTDFFEGNTYHIHEKVKWFKFENVYHVVNETGGKLGTVKQRMTGVQKIRHFFLGKFRPLAPFKLEIISPEDRVYAIISRGWNFKRGTITITDPNSNTLAVIKNKCKWLKANFTIEDPYGLQIAEISSNWKAKEFSIKDVNNFSMGQISKKWNGLAKELTYANQYHVNVDPAHTQHKIAIFCAAITMDMTFRNR